MIEKITLSASSLMLVLLISCSQPVKETYPNGAVKREVISGEGDTLIEKYYFEDGKPSSEAYYLDDALNGTWKTWFSNGNQESRGVFKDRKQEGVWSYFTDEGTKIEETTFKSGIKNGVSKTYFPNGKIKSSGIYAEGIQEGEWIFYKDDGAEVGRKLFRNGEVAK